MYEWFKAKVAYNNFCKIKPTYVCNKGKKNAR